MALFNFNFENKTLIIIISSLLWAINFRTTFKNIDKHMDLGSYSSLKFNPRLILIKNIICCFFIIFFYIEAKLLHSNNKQEIQIIKKKKDDMLILETKSKTQEKGVFESIYIYHRLTKNKMKFCFFLKNLLIIITIYIIEELYIIIGNNHIMERIICPIRNLSVFIGLLIFYPLIVKKCYVLHRHQTIPLIIIIFLYLFLLYFNSWVVDRFYNFMNVISFFSYFTIFILMGLEMILIKYLTDKQILNIFFIMGIKGIIGTIIFIIINFFFKENEFFQLFDNFLNFEYDDLYEDFDIAQKILYIASTVIVQYCKIYTINEFTETHFLYSLMLADIIIFPFYCFERFYIQDFGITSPLSFYSNLIIVIISFVLVLIINEILECKCCNFNVNIKKNITKRQLNDMNSTFND